MGYLVICDNFNLLKAVLKDMKKSFNKRIARGTSTFCNGFEISALGILASKKVLDVFLILEQLKLYQKLFVYHSTQNYKCIS